MQEIFTLLESSAWLLAAIIFLFGLLVGSFLNVVIYRLPLMMETGWKHECIAYLSSLELNADELIQKIRGSMNENDQFNLNFPLSHCPHCKSSIKPYQNIPVVSYLLLAGKCANCKYPISLRYPAIEMLTAVCSAIMALHFGMSYELLFALFFTWALIALSFIDIDHQLLPDSINLFMLWLGIFLNLFGLYTDMHSSVIGAIAGYMSLWIVFQLFKLLTGKEGMGFGDFKLLAMLGAWLGWQYLPLIIFLSSIVGAFIGISMMVLVKHERSQPIPFGPYLATAGWLAMLWGEQINQYYLESVGLV